MCCCHQELTAPCFTTQSFPHLQPCAAEHQHLGMVRAGQLQNVVPELCMPHGQPPPLLLSQMDATTARTLSSNKGLWKLMSYGHRSVGLSVPSANSAWPFSSVLPSARLVFTSCCNLLLLFSPSWEYNTCTRGNTGKSFNGKSNPWSRQRFKSLWFWKAPQQEQVLPLTQTGANCRISSGLQALLFMAMSTKSVAALCSQWPHTQRGLSLAVLYRKPGHRVNDTLMFPFKARVVWQWRLLVNCCMFLPPAFLQLAIKLTDL